MKNMGEYKGITFSQRHRIEELYASEARISDIANEVHKSSTAIYEELKRGATGKLDKNKRLEYSAEVAQEKYQESLRNRGRRRSD